MKLYIDHIITVTQQVEVPETCPGCDADLTKVNALKAWEFQDQSRPATNRKLEDGSFELDWSESMPESGECFLYVAWHCRECDLELLQNSEKRFDMGDEDNKPPTGILDMLQLCTSTSEPTTPTG